MNGRIYVGDRAPKAYVLVLRREDGDDIDLRTVTGATMSVKRNRESAAVTWAADITEAAADSITLTHVLAADGSDVPYQGVYAVFANLTIATGVLTSDTFALPVNGRFQFAGGQ